MRGKGEGGGRGEGKLRGRGGRGGEREGGGGGGGEGGTMTFLVYRLTKELERCNRIHETKLAIMQRK